jgi:tRNA threonylcarbamoyladenosine biosynthesis protein TsaE
MRAGAPSVRCPLVEDTQALGERLGQGLESGDLLSLEGPLGAGKTSLVRGIAIGLGVDPREVRSPTFVLHHVYTSARLRLHHLDLYRLGPGASLDLLDPEELLLTGAVCVEWGDYAALERWNPVRIAADIDAQRGRLFTLLTPGAPARISRLWGVSA